MTSPKARVNTIKICHFCSGIGYCERRKEALAQLKAALLEHEEIFPEKGIGSLKPVRAVRVEAIEAFFEGK